MVLTLPHGMSAVVILVAVASCGDGREVLPIRSVAVQGNQIAAPSNCHSGRRLEFDEGRDVIELTRSVEEADGGDCFDCLVVTLASDVGDRAIVDTATGRVVAQDGDPDLRDCFAAP